MKFRKIMGITIAASLISMSCMPVMAESVENEDNIVYAEGNSLEVTGDFNGAGAVAGGELLVNGNIIYNEDDYSAVFAMNDDSLVVIDGDVTTTGDYADAIQAYDGSEVIVSGDVLTTGQYSGGVEVTHADVMVGGDVKTTGEGSVAVYAENDSEVYIGGDVLAMGEDSVGIVASGHMAEPKSHIEVDGITIDNPEIYVAGDVSGTVYGLLVQGPSENTTVIIEGTLSSDQGAAIGYYPSQRDKAFPTILVGSLKSAEGELVELDDSYDSYEGESEAKKEALLASIYYIINAEGLTANNATDADLNSFVVMDTEFQVAHEGDTVILTPQLPENCILNVEKTFGAYAAKVINNGDGTYTIIVERGGDLCFVLTYDKIIVPVPEPTPTPEPAPVPAKAIEVASVERGLQIGDIIKLAKTKWILTAIDAKTGNYTLASVDELTDDEMEDMEAALKEMLTEEEMKAVIEDEVTKELKIDQVEQKDADLYFKGNLNHISIVVKPGIISASKIA